MPQPTMSLAGGRLYDLLGPATGPDEENGWPLAVYANGYAAMLDQVAALVSEQDDGTPGYVAYIFAPDSEPAEFLGVTEAFVGVNPYPSVAEPGRRLRIKQTSGRFRGTPGAIKGAARQFLEGPDGTPETATVYLNVRVGGVATAYTVTTLTAETPDAPAVLAALEEQKPAGFQLTHSVVAGGNWATLKAVHTDWADVKAQFATWGDLRADPSLT